MPKSLSRLSDSRATWSGRLGRSNRALSGAEGTHLTLERQDHGK
jgi:hypothetical protein